MAYQSLYRRFRPQTFAQVRGQQHLVQALRNAVRDDRVGHAYLFSGPRGTGKTTTARILAKALNCPNLVDGEPCDHCESCVAITDGRSLDVFELDAASNNGVDAIRDLIDRASQGSPGRRKVYILDEVHMLSAAASNALLKTLEEPPPHVVFVLATTDPQKVLPTIKSRTQHFEVHLLSSEELEGLVDSVIAEAGLEVPEGTRQYVLREGGGSARDTLSALDRVVALGAIPDEGDTVDELVEALCEHDTGRALLAVESGVSAGRAPRTLGEALMARLRDVFLASLGVELGRLSSSDRDRVADQGERLGARGATQALEVLGEAFVGIADAPDPRIPLEVALVRLTRTELDTTPAALLGRIERLEQAVAGGAGRPPADSPATSRPATGSTAGAPAASAAAPPAAAPSPGDAPVGQPGPFPEDPDGPGHHPDDVRHFPEDPDAPGPGEPVPPVPGPGGGLADAARQALAASRGERPTPRASTLEPASAPADTGPPPVRTRPPTASGARGPAAGPERGTTAPAADEPPAAADTPAIEPAPDTPAPLVGSDDLPSRDELVLAWGDIILGSLPQRAKVRYAGGRFVDVVDGHAVFGLPNDVHRSRCEEVRPEVEEVLAGHFGRPVPLRVVVDDGAPPPRTPGRAPRPEPAAADGSPEDPVAGRPGPHLGAVRVAGTTSDGDVDDDDRDDDQDEDEDEIIDMHDLVDATDAPVDEVDRIAEVFGDVEIVEEDPT